MNKAVWLIVACAAGGWAVACSSSSGSNGTQGTSSGGGGHTTTSMMSSSSGTTTTTDTTTSTTSTTTTTTSSGCTGATPVSLTVKNYLAWCSVSVAGGTASASSTQTVCVAAGATSVAATANTGFELGTKPWHDVDGDTGTGVQGTVTGSGATAKSTAMVTVNSGSKCVWVCCETIGVNDCPTTDQCP